MTVAHGRFLNTNRCNSFRSNIPYFDFPDFEEAIRDDCGKQLDNRFEPEAEKGGAGYVVEHPLHYDAERAQALCIRYTPEAAALAGVAADLLD